VQAVEKKGFLHSTSSPCTTTAPRTASPLPKSTPPTNNPPPQGDEDRVVPPEQAEEMHKALLARGLPTSLVMYKGEQHGFRSAAAIRSALEGELWFFGQVRFEFFLGGGI